MKIDRKYLPFLLLIIVIFFTEWFIGPFGDFSLNDDWAYAKSVYHWHQSGEFSIGVWPAMSLWSHALLGLSFVKLFGYSLSVLRLANMSLCLITLFFIYRYFCKSNKPALSALVCSFIVFNPYYLNLFNSFMTDLSFFNFSFLAFYFLNEFLVQNKRHYLFLFFVFALLATFTRQIGIILFLALLILSLIRFSETGLRLFLFSIISLTIALITLYVFEKYQHAKSASDAAYQGVFFSHHEIEIESGLIERILNKVLMIIKYSGSLFLPVLILNFNNLIHRAKNSNKLVLIGLFLLFIIWLIPNFNKNVVGNLVINLGLGIESTVDMLVVRGDDKHSSNDLLFFILVTIFALGYLLFTLSLASFNLNLKSWKVLDIQKMFIIIVLVLYLLLIGIAKSSFDRYSIYFMLFSVVFFMSKERKFRIRELLVSVFFFALIFLYSVLGTYDYLNAARLKHHILSDLVNKRQVSVNQINAGFEYQLWSGGDEEISWSNWVDYKNKEFIIARNVIPDFELYETHTYKRFLPVKLDTFFVLKNKHLK